MTDMTKDQFVELLRPLAESLRAIDVDAPDAAAQAEAAAAFGGEDQQHAEGADGADRGPEACGGGGTGRRP